MASANSRPMKPAPMMATSRTSSRAAAAQRQAVLHHPQRVHARQIQARQQRADFAGAGGDHQFVVSGIEGFAVRQPTHAPAWRVSMLSA